MSDDNADRWGGITLITENTTMAKKKRPTLNELLKKRDSFYEQYNEVAEIHFELERQAAVARKRFHELIELYELMQNEVAWAADKAGLSDDEMRSNAIDPELVRKLRKKRGG
jgi:hypothetical protein